MGTGIPWLQTKAAVAGSEGSELQGQSSSLIFPNSSRRSRWRARGAKCWIPAQPGGKSSCSSFPSFHRISQPCSRCRIPYRAQGSAHPTGMFWGQSGRFWGLVLPQISHKFKKYSIIPFWNFSVKKEQGRGGRGIPAAQGKQDWVFRKQGCRERGRGFIPAVPVSWNGWL